MITRKNKPRRRQAGVAAVELAILLPLLFVLLSAPLFIGRVLWHYTVAQKAAHDAARYLATVSEGEMRTPALTLSAVAAANAIANAELSELNPGPYGPAVGILCDAIPCNGFALPTAIRVNVQIEMHDPFFPTGYGGDYGLLISAEAQMSYLGTK